MLAHEIGVPAVLRGDFEVQLLEMEAEVCQRARRRRALERRAGAQARVHARRWQHREGRRQRQCETLLPSSAEEARGSVKMERQRSGSIGQEISEHAGTDPEDEGMVGIAQPGPSSEKINKVKESMRMKRLTQLSTRSRKRLHRLNKRKAIFDDSVQPGDREAIVDAFTTFAEGGIEFDAKLQDISALLDCLFLLGVGGDNRDEHHEVMRACEELLASNDSIDLHGLGTEALPRARAGILEAQRPKALEHFRRLCKALRSDHGGERRLSIVACMVAIDSSLGDMSGGRLAPMDDALLERIMQSLCHHHAEWEGASEDAFMDAVQIAREAVSRFLRDGKRVRALASEASAHLLAPTHAWDTRSQVDAAALEASLKFVIGWNDAASPAEEAPDWTTKSLDSLQMQGVFCQMGLEPVWRGRVDDFCPLERIIWTCCQDMSRQVDKDRRNFDSCKRFVEKVRYSVLKLTEQFLEDFLSGPDSTGQQRFTVGQAIAALKVSPQTPAEREAVSQEIDAAGGDPRSDGLFSCRALAEMTLRAQERLQRDRRADELRAATAVGLQSELQRLRNAFVSEAFSPTVVARRGPQARSNRQQQHAAPQPSGQPIQCKASQVAIGDGGVVSANGLRNIFLRLDQPLTPKVAVALASIVAGERAPEAEVSARETSPDSRRPAPSATAAATAIAAEAADAKVDFAGILLAMRLAKDCSVDVLLSSQPTADVAEAEGVAQRRFSKKTEPLEDRALRTVMLALSMPGRLTLALPREQLEAMAISTLIAEAAQEAEKEGPSVGIGRERKLGEVLQQKMKLVMEVGTKKAAVLQQPLPVLVRKARRWAIENTK